LTMESALLCLA